MRIQSALWATALCLAPVSAVAQDFYEYWGDGRAEVSSYKVVEFRYGEERSGYGVLIFVTEDVNRNTLIKVESKTPKQDRVYALKLNNVLKFTTGVYDYSVMTSVFSAIEPSMQSEPFELIKLSLSSQEWCGHVFEEVRVTDDRLLGDLISYFEREGRQQWSFDQPHEFASEDHLLIRIRELKGAFMAEGESRTMTMLPSLWQFRIRHQERKLVEVTLAKGTREGVNIDGTEYQAVPWTWSYGKREKTVWVETAYPHRILRWESSNGRGELMVSKRMPYWGLHGIGDEHLRDELEISR